MIYQTIIICNNGRITSFVHEADDPDEAADKRTRPISRSTVNNDLANNMLLVVPNDSDEEFDLGQRTVHQYRLVKASDRWIAERVCVHI